MKPAIRIDHLSKRYQLGTRSAAGYQTLREVISQTLTAPLRRLQGLTQPAGQSPASPADTIWALNDVSFEVQPGEVIGIIGRNGAGKSTLLKILSRITEPTSGRAELRGRVGSLLEVGTGFHAELTGRENIYLNGSVLGMTRREITRSFDAIVAFAEIEPFLDTPVKRYSSGMYVRLAFAVAAHLQPEILIVDEVLAVGDVAFQQKCLGKMGDVARGGRTVLLVSHNMAAVENLCSRAVVLNQGRTEFIGEVAAGVAAYLRCGGLDSPEKVSLAAHRAAGLCPVIQDIRVTDDQGHSTTHCQAGAGLTFTIHYDAPMPLRDPRFNVLVETLLGERLFFLQTYSQYGSLETLPQRGVVRCQVPRLPLIPGTYALSFGFVLQGERLDYLERVLHIQVESADVFGTGRLPPANRGHFLVPAQWSFQDAEKKPV